jgi:hypothetical protein
MYCTTTTYIVGHSRESGNPATLVLSMERHWIPAFAGMTVLMKLIIQTHA